MFREWADGRAARAADASAPPPRQLFVTASAALRTQVARAFRRLQWAVLTPRERSALAAASGGGCGGEGQDECGPASLAEVDDAAWPLFLTGTELLRLLDEALPGERTCMQRECMSIGCTSKLAHYSVICSICAPPLRCEKPDCRPPWML